MVGTLDEATLKKIERDHSEGLTSQQILDLLGAAQVKLSEATLRKYVQLGLLPRSIRVGRKGKHQGSQGVYPVTVLRQVIRIRTMMARDYTIEQIQREFLFVRGDIEQLERVLTKIFQTLSTSSGNVPSELTGRAVAGELRGARKLARDLVEKLTSIESRLVVQAGLSRAVG